MVIEWGFRAWCCVLFFSGRVRLLDPSSEGFKSHVSNASSSVMVLDEEEVDDEHEDAIQCRAGD